MSEMTITRSAVEAGAALEIRVAGPVTIAQAAAFKEALVQALEGAQEVCCDLSQVTEMDLAPLQLLCAAHGSASAQGKVFRVAEGDSEVYQKTVSEAGFQRHVGCLRDAARSCIWVGG